MVIPVAAAAAGGSALWGSLGAAGISAAGNIAAGLFGGSKQSTPDTSTFYQNWRNDDMAWAREQFDRNEALQREFAQQGIRWRVEDAKAAGLHPLAALGASGASAAPISVGGGGSYQVDPGRSSSTSGFDFRGMGQDLSRAYLATRSPEEKVMTQFELARQAQQLQYGDLQNQEMALRIARLSQQTRSGGMPSNVTDASGSWEAKPPEVTNTNPRQPATEAGPSQASNRIFTNPDGSKWSNPAKELQIDEWSSPGWTNWMIHNRLLPFTGDKYAEPPKSHLPPGAIGWTHHFGSWYPRYPSKDFSHLPKRPTESPYMGGGNDWRYYR